MVQYLLKHGMHPSEIRRRLRASGVRWKYSVRGQGGRERSRRLKQLSLCVNGDGRWRAAPSDLCADCLRKKWAPGTVLPAQPSAD